MKRSTSCGLLLTLTLAVPAAAVAGDDLFAGDLTASAITQQSAVVSGNVEAGSGEEAPTWRIRYGTTSALEDATRPARVPVGIRPGPLTVYATLTRLPAATRIYARLEVSSGTDEHQSDVMSFVTDPAPGATPEPAEPGAPPAEPSVPAAPSAPELGANVGAEIQQGRIQVRMPGTDRFVPLPSLASLPVGTVVDARDGAIVLTAVLPGGDVQRGSFGGARFKLSQTADGRVDLRLRGGSFADCGARSVSALAARKKPRAVRRIWGRDRSGRFRTHGRDSVTTVRGTAWSVADRCDGTVTRVTEGAVDVRVRRTGRVVRLAAGERFLARHRR